MTVSFARLVISAILITILWAPVASARTIAVVYDDSGSMMGGGRSGKPSFDLRFAYASYALQTLRALLSSKDKLIVTFMNDSTHISTNGAANDIKTLERRSHVKSSSGNTPYGAVTNAMRLLEKEKDEKDRWLIIITDGQFQGVPGNLNDQIAEFQQKIPGVKVICFGIAAGAGNKVFEAWKGQAEATVLNSPPSREISGRMQQVAAMVSANTTGAGIKPEIKGSEVTFTSPFPLKRFIVMQQSESPGDMAEVVEVLAGSSKVKLLPGVRTGTPSIDPQLGTLHPLHGMVSHVEPAVSGELIPQGALVKVRLSKALSGKTALTILPEVSVKLKVSLFDYTGAEIKPDAGKVYASCPDRTVTVKAQLDFGSSGAALIQNISGTKVTFFYDRTPTTLKWDGTTGSFNGTISVVDGLKTVRTNAEHEGYINIHDTGQIQAIDSCTPRNVSFRTSSGGTEIHNWTADVRDLGKVLPLEIAPFIDQKSLAATEFNTWTCSAEAPSGLKLKVKKAKSGSGWEISPLQRWCTPCLTLTGTFPVKVVYNGKADVPLTGLPADGIIVRVNSKAGTAAANEVVSYPAATSMEVRNPGFFKRCWLLIAAILLLLLCLIWAFGVWKKPRFGKGSVVTYQRGGASARQITEPLPRSFFHRWVIPYIPETNVIEGMKFKAGSSSRHIYLVKESLSDNIRKDGFPVERMDRDLRIEDGEAVEYKGNANIVQSYKYQA